LGMLYNNELVESKNAEMYLYQVDEKVDTYTYTRGNHMKCT